MVSRRKRARTVAIIALAVLCLALLAAGFGSAQEETEPTIEEEYRVVLNDVGDGRVTDTIKYSRDDYEVIKNVESESRGFLTRRLTTDDTVGELADFNTDLDDDRRSVVISYDRPGYAYNEKGEFSAYGFPEKPSKASGGVFTFESESTINSEFTLFTDQVISTTTTIELPDKASEARYDPEDKAIKYRMPPAETLLGFWSENKSLLSVIFGVLAVSFAGLLVLVVTRPATAPARAEAVASPGARPAAPSAATEPERQQAQQVQAAPGEVSPRFCRKCGSELSPGKRFCTKCGTRV